MSNRVLIAPLIVRDEIPPIMNLRVRRALASDWPAISAVVTAAFGDVQGKEIEELVADLLDDKSARPLLSLVATADNTAVGHILFTSAHIRGATQGATSAILAPLSVRPEFQGRGIGGQLIREGLDQLKAAGFDLVFVLGHPGYYPKHGFTPAGIHGLDAPHPIPPDNSDAWMVVELGHGVIGRVNGQVECAEALNHPKHWRE